MLACTFSCFYLLQAEQGFYFVEKSPSGLLNQKFEHLISNHTAVPQEVKVLMGRILQVPLGANGCAYFTFEELCDKPLGAALQTILDCLVSRLQETLAV